MVQERPSNSPLHGKRVYVYIGQTDTTAGIEFVTYATEFSVNLTPQNTARAVAMGTDAVGDVETHGMVARARVNLLLTSAESAMLLALNGTDVDTDEAGGQEVDYVTNVSNYISNEDFTQMARLTVVIASLEQSPSPATAGEVIKLSDIENGDGFTIRMVSSAIVGFEITGRIGEYSTARLEVESGRFKINANPEN